MKLIKYLLLITSLTFLAGCESTQSGINTRIKSGECSIFKRIEFTNTTKNWLGDLEWPQEAYGDFHKISKHNLKITKFCTSNTTNIK